MPQTQRPTDFMPDEEAAQGRRDDRLRAGGPQFFRQGAAERFRMLRILQHQRTLEELPAVQPGSEQKMPFQQRTGIPKDLENGWISHIKNRLFIACFHSADNYFTSRCGRNVVSGSM